MTVHTSHVVKREMTSLLSDSAKSLLPNQHALKMVYKRQRIAPPNPVSVEELQLYAENIKTLSNRNFLFYNSGIGPDRIVIFATRKNIEFLAMSKIWLADGTLKTVPTLFSQLNTVHCLIGGPNTLKMAV